MPPTLLIFNRQKTNKKLKKLLKNKHKKVDKMVKITCVFVFHVKLIKNSQKMLHVKQKRLVLLKIKNFHNPKIVDFMRDFEKKITQKTIKNPSPIFLSD